MCIYIFLETERERDGMEQNENETKRKPNGKQTKEKDSHILRKAQDYGGRDGFFLSG